jgi:hypothetical protein
MTLQNSRRPPGILTPATFCVGIRSPLSLLRLIPVENRRGASPCFLQRPTDSVPNSQAEVDCLSSSVGSRMEFKNGMGSSSFIMLVQLFRPEVLNMIFTDQSSDNSHISTYHWSDGCGWGQTLVTHLNQRLRYSMSQSPSAAWSVIFSGSRRASKG